MEVPILYYNYRCHIRHYDDPNLRKIIQLHIQVCEEIGNRECLPVEGDLITLAFECKGEEQFFYDWLNEGAVHNGEIHFIYNEVEIADIFRFWDCFCVKIEEYMSVGNSPMMMVLYLSPGIIKRNNLEVREKVWKVSEPTFSNYKKSNDESMHVSNNIVLVTAVDGVKSTTVCQNVKYNVVSYNVASDIVSIDEKLNIKWVVVVDGKIYKQKSKGEILSLYILPEWYGKEIIVMPYLKKYTSKVSVITKVEVWKLPVLFAKSSNDPGKDSNGEVPDDLKYGDLTKKEALKIQKLNKLQINASDNLLFEDLSILTSVFTVLGGKENMRKLIQNFRDNKGAIFSSKYMDDALASHPTLKQFIYDKEGVLENLNEQLRSVNGNINKIETLQGVLNSTRPKFSWRSGSVKNIVKDLFSGMTMAVDDTSAYLVFVESYELVSANTYNAVLRIESYDNFGLNPADIQCGFGLLAGFRSWFILQHVRGYKPFLTKMTYKLYLNNRRF